MDGAREPLSVGLPVWVRGPQWDHDGTRVFGLVAGPGSGEPYFGWIDVATRQLTRIPVPATGVANLPSLSPDGRQLAFNVIGPDGVVNVWVQRLDGGARRQVTFDREAMSYPRWSQDGQWLAVNIKRGDTTQVGVVPAKGGPVEQLTSGPGPRWPYTFSPDNDQGSIRGWGAGRLEHPDGLAENEEGEGAHALHLGDCEVSGMVAARRPDRIRARGRNEQSLDGEAPGAQ